jgi:methylmalonyl-CoA mutase
MATNLDDFDPVSSKQWKQKIQFELKEQITTKP